MKILHAIQSTDPTRGGPIEGILQIAHATKDIHSHQVVSLDPPDAAYLPTLGVRITALGPSSILGYSGNLVPWLRRHAGQFDLVVIHGLWRYISFGSWRALSGMGVPYMVMPHGMLDPWFKHQYPFKHLKKWLFWPWTEYRVLRDARAVIFTCDEERRLARESFWLYQCNEAVGTVGIAGPNVNLQTAREQFLAAYPQLRGTRVLLFLGRIHEKKGCDLLMHAFAHVARSAPDLRLVMVGPCHDGWDRALRAICESQGVDSRVLWTGMLTGDMKWGAFAASEAFVLPSHQENFGIAVAEALSCAKPVLISNKVQIWREIDADGAGLVADDTQDATAQLLMRWLNLSASQREVMAKAARRCFETRFESAHYASVMTRLYEQALVAV